MQLDIFNDAITEQLRVTSTAEEHAKKTKRRADWNAYLGECRMLHRIIALQHEIQRTSAAVTR